MIDREQKEINKLQEKALELLLNKSIKCKRVVRTSEGSLFECFLDKNCEIKIHSSVIIDDSWLSIKLTGMDQILIKRFDHRTLFDLIYRKTRNGFNDFMMKKELNKLNKFIEFIRS